MPVPHDRLLQLYRGELPPDEAAALSRRLAEDAALRHEYDQVADLANALSSTAALSMGPYFADRVMARLRAVPALDPAVAFGDALRSLFLRTALASLVLVAGLATLAQRDARVHAQSFLDTALGLPSTEVETLLAYDSEALLPLSIR